MHTGAFVHDTVTDGASMRAPHRVHEDCIEISGVTQPSGALRHFF